MFFHINFNGNTFIYYYNHKLNDRLGINAEKKVITQTLNKIYKRIIDLMAQMVLQVYKDKIKTPVTIEAVQFIRIDENKIDFLLSGSIR